MEYRTIVNFHFTRTRVHEVTQLEQLLEPLWSIGNVYADSGYLSVNNCWLIVTKGGTPFIRPKNTNTGKSKHENPFTEMIQRYNQNKEEWFKQYHQRSIIEAVFSALKRRLGGFVTSIKRRIQQIEIALKIIIYNLMILVRKRVEDEYF